MSTEALSTAEQQPPSMPIDDRPGETSTILAASGGACVAQVAQEIVTAWTTNRSKVTRVNPG